MRRLLLIALLCGCAGSLVDHASVSAGGGVDAGVTSTVSSVAPLAGKTVNAVAAGSAHTCAVVEGDGVWCWGDDSSGQSGGANPHKVNGTDGALKLAAGSGHTCFATGAQTF